MQLEPAFVIFAVSVIAAAGAGVYRLGALEARVRELEAFRIRGGERLGRLEENARHVRRSLTSPAGHLAAAGQVVDAGGRVLAPVDHDESSA